MANSGFMEKVNAHLNNTAFYQTIFSLPFAYIAVLLADREHIDWGIMFWVTIVIFAARSAALALDNLIDLKYDKQQKRLAKRAMVAGRVGRGEVLIMIGICFVIMIFAVLQLQPICIKLLPIAAIPFVIYPYTKRFTNMCHIACGACVAMAPAGGWVAVTGTIDYQMVIIYLAVTLWIGGFDMAYGAQDEEFDRAHGLHSMAVTYGKRKAMLLARWVHVVTILLFVLMGVLFSLGAVYYVGILVAAAALYYQHTIISPHDFSAITHMYYLRNGIVSVAIFVAVVLDLYVF